jgi:integrase
MARAYPHSHLVAGKSIGFSVKQFGDSPSYFACFRDADGRRLKRDTNHARLGQAVDIARAIIEKEFAPPETIGQNVTWDDTIKRLSARLATSGNRTSTLDYYLKCIRLVRGKTAGPAEITPAIAAKWRDDIMTTVNRRKKLPSPHYVAGMLTGLSSLWQKWFVDDLKIVGVNPWADVTAPRADKIQVRFATDEQIADLYKWTGERFGDWPFPRLFLATKAFTGCRLLDLCSMKSAQLRGGRLIFPANTAKGRKERAVPLSKELFASLDAFKGKVWLWEGYLPGLLAALTAKGFPTHQMNPEFSPQRLYYWVETLFADYRKANTDKPLLTTHMFRKRAFTMAWKAGMDARRASIAYGCNVDTLMRHYVDLDEQAVTDEVFAAMSR